PPLSAPSEMLEIASATSQGPGRAVTCGNRPAAAPRLLPAAPPVDPLVGALAVRLDAFLLAHWRLLVLAAEVEPFEVVRQRGRTPLTRAGGTLALRRLAGVAGRMLLLGHRFAGKLLSRRHDDFLRTGGRGAIAPGIGALLPA